VAKIICICLRKGGSGKTTTAVNLAAGLQLRGRKTLLVDLDDQANATMCAGINPFTLERSISTLFTDITARPQDVLVPTEFGITVLPATPSLEQVAAGMNATSIGDLRPIMESLDDLFDYIVIDTQPGHSYLSLSALVAAHWALIPLQAHYLAMEGLARIMTDIQKVQVALNPQLQVFGIMPCMVQSTTISQGVVNKTRQDYPGLVLDIEVRLSIRFVNSSLEGVPLVISSPSHASALEYMRLVDLMISRLEENNA
jgi:chromosome partitioning protein